MTSVASHSALAPAPCPIAPLSPSTRSLLRSAPLLFSLPQCIAELVENTLDASASHIHVVVDCARLSFSVADDGRGMSAEELERCGTRHWTTKAERRGRHGQYVYGARGEALASLADIATLDITTTPSRRRSRVVDEPSPLNPSSPQLSSRVASSFTHRKRMSASSTAAVLSLPSTSSQCCGTTVAVTALYSNLPVRRRLLLSRSDRERESIKRRLERIALVHRHVVFTLWDEEHRRQLLSKGRLTDLPSSFGELYRHELAASLLPVMRLDCDAVSVRLYVSSLTAGYHTRDFHFVYINRRPVLQPTLQRLINQCWQQCRLFMEGGATPGMRVLHPVFVLLLELDDDSYDCLLQSDKQLVALAEQEAVDDAVRRCLHTGLMERYPVLRERASELFDHGEGDDRRNQRWKVTEERQEGAALWDERSEVGDAFIDLTGDVVVHPLSRTDSHLGNTLSVQTQSSHVDQAVPLRCARRSFSSVANTQHGSASSSTKPRHALGTDTSATTAALRIPASPQPSDEKQHRLGEVTRAPAEANDRLRQTAKCDAWQRREMNSPVAASHCAGAEPHFPSATPIDDNAADALLFPVFHAPALEARPSKRCRVVDSTARARATEPVDLTAADGSEWSEGRINSNSAEPVVSNPSQPYYNTPLPFQSVINSTTTRKAHLETAPPGPARSLQSALDREQYQVVTSGTARTFVPLGMLGDSSAPANSSSPFSQRFSSSQADRLTFASTVNANSLPHTSSHVRAPVLSLHKRSLQAARIVGQVDQKYVLCLLEARHLVAVDQHAADERVRLEDLEAHTAQLVSSQPLAQPLRCELTAIEAGTLELYRQQIDRWGWRLVRGSEQSAHTYDITHCPALLLPPVACVDSVDSLRDYLAQLSRSLRPPSHSQLPEPLLSLLHSRACKSAIRFGDRLSTQQQVALVRALSARQLPFQCAHGRPSMQPLVQLREQRAREQGQLGTAEGCEAPLKWWKQLVRRKLGRLTVVQGQFDEVGEVSARQAPFVPS